jgi:hypothetical protein
MEMRLPRFTAEDSLGRMRANYEVASTHASPAVSGTVLAQFFRCHGNWCCDEFGYCIYRGRVLM